MILTNSRGKKLMLIATLLCLCSFLVKPVLSDECPSTLEKIKKTGKFTAGVRFDYPPVGYIDSNENIAGFGPDIARALAEKLGVQVELVQSTSKTRIPLIQNGIIDAEIGPTTCSVKRAGVIDFTIPYCWDDSTFLTRKGGSLKAKDYGPPKILATTQGSHFPETFRTVVGIKNANFKRFQEYNDCVIALVKGKVDAVLINRVVAIKFAKQFDLAIGEGYVKDPWGIIVRENDSKWRKFINFSLQELWRDGVYQKLHEKNFGYPPNFNLWSEYRLQPGIAHVQK